MKKIKLFLLRATYFVDCKIGPFMVNDRKYDSFVEGLKNQQKRIEHLKDELKNC